MPFIVEQFTSVMSEAFFSLLEIQIDSLLTSIVETVLKNSIQKKGKKKRQSLEMYVKPWILVLKTDAWIF